LKIGPSLAAVPLVLLLWAAGAPARAQTVAEGSHIAFLDAQRLITDSKPAKAADARIVAEFSSREKALQQRIAQFRSDSEKFAAESAGMEMSRRTARSRELLAQQKDIERQQREFGDDLSRRQNEERAALTERIYVIIEKIVAQEKIDVVLRTAVWTSPRIEITDKVLKELDK
jgi:outer membrane protein